MKKLLTKFRLAGFVLGAIAPIVHSEHGMLPRLTCLEGSAMPRSTHWAKAVYGTFRIVGPAGFDHNRLNEHAACGRGCFDSMSLQD